MIGVFRVRYVFQLAVSLPSAPVFVGSFILGVVQLPRSTKCDDLAFVWNTTLLTPTVRKDQVSQCLAIHLY